MRSVGGTIGTKVQQLFEIKTIFLKKINVFPNARILVAVFAVLLAMPLKAQFAVIDPTNLAQGIVNTAKQIVETSTTAKNMIIVCMKN